MPPTRFHGDDLNPHDYFTGQAAGYLRTRPTYSPEALRWVLSGLPDGARVADVGTGPGICARGLAAQGARVVGIEPNPDMVGHAARATQTTGEPVRYVRACAETTGLANGSLDGIVCSQSFQWCDPERALPEFHRVLRPGGRLAVLFNFGDRREPSMRAYLEIMERARRAARRAGRTVAVNRTDLLGPTPLFRQARTRRFENAHLYDWTRLRGRAASTSFFPASGGLREELFRALRVVFDRYAEDGLFILERFTAATVAGRV